MAACGSCRVNHSPYTCAQYAALARGENRADRQRLARRAAKRPGLLARLLGRRR
jgi:hypothetical protein